MRTQTLQNSQGAITSTPVIFLMLQEIIIIGSSGILTFISSQIFHELGHFIVYKKFGYKPRFGFNNFKIPNRVTAYSSVTNHFTEFKLNLAILAGILTGLIPVFIYFSVFKAVALTTWLLLVYLYYCRSDFKSFVNKEAT